MIDLWSIRMRASKSTSSRRSASPDDSPRQAVSGQKSKVSALRRIRRGGKNQSSEMTEIHISGAEGLYKKTEIEKIVKGYTLRAMSHSKGVPDKVVITVEKVKQKPLLIPLLPVFTLKPSSPKEARKIVHKLLSEAGVSIEAIQNGIKVVTGKTVLRGASLMSAGSGIRVEPDKERGVRVSRIGISKNTERNLSRRLKKENINTTTVKEAVILASKVASCQNIIAELCISDDPDYTTGYVAARKMGYVRIPNIKDKGSLKGGRVFFIEENSCIEHIIEYLKEIPAIAGKPSVFKGIMSLDEAISDTHR